MVNKIAFAKKKILVIDDEKDLLELIEVNLVREGFVVRCATSGEEGLKNAILFKPDLILLDLMLPGIDGYETCRLMRQNPSISNIPIIMLTAKGEDVDIITGLELGADDYVTKPFSPKVLIARIRNLLRSKLKSPKKNIVRLHSITIDPAQRVVLANGRKISITTGEFNLLSLLASHQGEVFTRGQIIDALRGENYSVTERAIDVQIVSLRKKLGKAGKYIETIYGVGYKFIG